MSYKIKELLTSKGLYEPVDLGIEYLYTLREMCKKNISIDLFCEHCNERSVFVKISPEYMTDDYSWEYAVNNSKFEFLCSRDRESKASFFLYAKDNKIMKIGQHPSYMDVSLIIPTKYSVLLGSYYSEYKSATILFSHGFCVGAYAHLRRIIEHLIADAATQAVNDGANTQSVLDTMRVSDRVAALNNYLPDFFVQNVPLYGIISKGIHELSEDECREFFPVLQTAIEITLDEEIERRSKAAKAKQAQGAIGKIAGLLGSKKP